MTAAMGDLPPAGGWTINDLEALPQDGIRRELLDGVLHVVPSPSPTHQVLAARLMVALEESCPADWHVSQANDVVLSQHRSFIPDVLVTTDESAARNGAFSARDVILAIEIVSPSSQSMDRVMKPALYAKARIPFYWLIETDSGLIVHAYQLDHQEEIYQPVGSFDEMIKLDEPWQIEVPIARLRPRHL